MKKSRTEQFGNYCPILFDDTDPDDAFNAFDGIDDFLCDIGVSIDDGIGDVAFGAVHEVADIEVLEQGRDLVQNVGNVFVDDGQAMCRVKGHFRIRQIDGVADVAGLEVLRQLIGGHVCAVVLGFRSGGTEMRHGDDSGNTEKGIFRKVGNVRGNLAFAKSGNHVFGVNQSAAGKVEDADSVFHLGDGLGTDGISGVIIQRNMDGDVVTVRKDLIDIGGVVNGAGKVPGGIDGEIRVIAVNLHAEAFGCVGNQDTDGTEADYAELFALNFRSLKGGFAFFNLLAVLVAAALEGVGKVNSRNDFTGGEKQSADDKLFYGIGVGTRGVKDNNAFLCALVNRNVVCAGAGTGNGEKALRKLHVMHFGRADNDGIRIFDGVAVVVFRGVQLIQAGLQTSNNFIPNPDLRAKFQQAVDAAGYSQLGVMGLVATKAAYDHGEEWLEAVTRYIQENIEYTVNYINEIPGLKTWAPDGTYLLWIDCRGLGLNTQELDEFILNDAKLWLDSGAIFGACGEGFQRINVACPRATLDRGLAQLKEAVLRGRAKS